MQIELIEQENENHNNSAISKTETSAPLHVNRRTGRPLKTNNCHFRLTLYLAYPTEEQKQRLRNMAKAFNLENKMRLKRMLKIANTPSEAEQMVMQERKDRAMADRKYRVWLRRKKRFDEAQYLKEFTEACMQYAKVIKNSRPIDDNQDFQDEQDVSR
ncbi:MAG: hypothetical protein IKZ34_03580 [Alphaproteobacteria bacterium]|nr:hypothetical protein [Alphaproteobacteria bacterium]